MKIVNAIIENVELEIEDHGILTCTLFLDFGGLYSRIWGIRSW
jgi:hypothetical protein